jgi:hypothetical protein
MVFIGFEKYCGVEGGEERGDLERLQTLGGDQLY